jgi:hypothetical protein
MLKDIYFCFIKIGLRSRRNHLVQVTIMDSGFIVFLLLFHICDTVYNLQRYLQYNQSKNGLET